MAATRRKILIGGAMVGVGLIQASSYGIQHEWLPTTLGLLYAGLGVAYLWAEVYSRGE